MKTLLLLLVFTINIFPNHIKWLSDIRQDALISGSMELSKDNYTKANNHFQRAENYLRQIHDLENDKYTPMPIVYYDTWPKEDTTVLDVHVDTVYSQISQLDSLINKLNNTVAAFRYIEYSLDTFMMESAYNPHDTVYISVRDCYTQVVDTVTINEFPDKKMYLQMMFFGLLLGFLICGLLYQFSNKKGDCI